VFICQLGEVLGARAKCRPYYVNMEQSDNRDGSGKRCDNRVNKSRRQEFLVEKGEKILQPERGRQKKWIVDVHLARCGNLYSFSFLGQQHLGLNGC